MLFSLKIKYVLVLLGKLLDKLLHPCAVAEKPLRRPNDLFVTAGTGSPGVSRAEGEGRAGSAANEERGRHLIKLVQN